VNGVVDFVDRRDRRREPVEVVGLIEPLVSEPDRPVDGHRKADGRSDQ